MAQFRPYGGHEQRVVSDLSRFDYEGAGIPLRKPSVTPSEISSSKLTLDTIIPLYSSRIDERDNRGYSPLPTVETPAEHEHDLSSLPEVIDPPTPKSLVRIRKKHISVGVQVPQDNPNLLVGPTPPPKESVRPPRIPENVPENDLPPMPQPQAEKSRAQFADAEVGSLSSKRKQLEQDLIKSVMNRPLVKFHADRFGPDFAGKEITISVNFFIYLFEIMFCIIEIVISSVLLDNDSMIPVDVYRYFIADGVMGLIISLLLIFQAITYERRNGSFYCLAVTIMKLVAFILIVSVVFPSPNYAYFQIWELRRAVGAFIIISMFLWLTNLIMFVTTLYISRLNLLQELNFDYSDQGLDDKFNKRGIVTEKEEDLKEFYLNENGEMFALTEDWEKEQYKGRNKILVYTF
ncbi:uncharacterized protein SPAPADRAFT_59379 [Spathaspora passalidarum NRRL Y-27907]|uniref:Uncharacterized protein n=1 Tax=Spathaspora passalidarum (strain NRRL Y-27907 / 11-Y1) TaxID=619300 RepID=G3AJR7_SPAPN|nr:uncharacterized protein SPAPADRAFT_59379 [Spathaspora passalidarum NRRL Y-27907]EGW33968.1 hypothetical protein SPAPADRAFT_59379 [Spathaspora passalidarum NRRL Y-27907]